MGLMALLTKHSTKLGDLTIDAAIDELHEMEAEISDYPIESGSTGSDNRRILPRRYSLQGVVASSPKGLVGAVINGLPLTIQRGYNALEKLFETEEPFDVVTRLKVYKNMMFTRLSVPRNNAQGEAVFFSGELRQITIVNTSTSVIKRANAASNPAAKGEAGCEAHEEGAALDRAGVRLSAATGRQSRRRSEGDAMTRVLQASQTLQDFEYRVELDEETFTLRFRWNTRAATWFVDISDSDEEPIVMGRPLNLDTTLLRQFRHLAVPGGDLMSYDSTKAKVRAGVTDLGERVLVLYLEAAQLAAV